MLLVAVLSPPPTFTVTGRALLNAPRTMLAVTVTVGAGLAFSATPVCAPSLSASVSRVRVTSGTASSSRICTAMRSLPDLAAAPPPSSVSRPWAAKSPRAMASASSWASPSSRAVALISRSAESGEALPPTNWSFGWAVLASVSFTSALAPDGRASSKSRFAACAAAMAAPVVVVMSRGICSFSPAARLRPSVRVKVALPATSPSVRAMGAPAVSATSVASSSVIATFALSAPPPRVYSPLPAALRVRVRAPSARSASSPRVGTVNAWLAVLAGNSIVATARSSSAT